MSEGSIDQSIQGPNYCLSGKPKLTPKGGKTKRWNLFSALSWSLYFWIVARSSASSLIRSARLASMRAGVTDLARTEEPRATVTVLVFDS